MNPRFVSCAALLAFLLAPIAANAQAATPAGASAPAPARATGPRPQLLSPVEKGELASPEGKLRPERQVTPQISIPIGRNAAETSKPTVRAAAPQRNAPAGTINEAAARCEAQVDEQVRAVCRDKLAQQSKKPRSQY